MKKIIATLLAATQVTTAMAHVGGPWSFGTYDNNNTGTYTGIVTGNNLTGIIRFTQSNTAQISAFSSSMMYFKGYTYLGSCQASLDLQAKTIAGVTNGNADNQSPNSPASTPPLNDSLRRASISIVTQATGATGTGGDAETRNVTIALDSGPIGIANSHFRGKVTSTAPVVRFKARGEASFYGSLEQTGNVHTTYALTVGDITDSTGDNNTFLPIPVAEDFGTKQDFGGNDPIVKPRNRTKIMVYGSMISNQVNVPYNSASTLAGTGGGGFSF